jgi:hypothetical protein
MTMADDFEVGGPPPEEASNRAFIIAAAGIGGLLVLSMICLGAYALFFAPGRQAARATEAALQLTRNVETAIALTETAGAPRATLPPTNTPTATRTQTATPVVILATETPSEALPTVDPRTATAAAQRTALAQQSPTPTRTALPQTGFVEDVGGVPGMLLIGLGLVVVLVIARSLRTRTSD